MISPPFILARRFVAGPDGESAIAVGRRLQARGIRATFDLLGEDVLDEDAARRSVKANEELLRKIPPEVERNISVKLTMLGLEISPEFCLENVASLLEAARGVGGFVRIDMEGSKHTQRTLDIFHELRQRHHNVGIVLQAYLHRTPGDVKDAIARGDRVRLCKGAYKEPPETAIQEMDAIRAAYRALAHQLVDGGNYPAIATHDESLIRDVLDYTAQRGIASDRYEFQMLYGLRPRRWDELVASGHRVRIYVPYGTHWFPYFYRRLRERKENVLFVLRSLLGG
ncbi:MAG: proline dehydrogenase [Acidobacteria bacterium]|nr:MAG: proline dehydrogenase [Acidobacteriota bacterium]